MPQPVSDLEYNDFTRFIGDLLSLSGGADLRQFVHKLNRMLVEMEYAKTNLKKFLLLTQREKEIITLVVLGNNNPQISRQLFISRHTVEQHRKNINRKLETNTLAELCVFAYAYNLI